MSRDLEKDLREALARVQPPKGFADRVAARLPEQRRRPPLYWFAAVAAGLALVFAAHFGHKQYETSRHAPEIQRQLAFAFQLTAEKLAVIDGRLKRSAPELKIDRAKGDL